MSGGSWGPKDNDPAVQARSKENSLPIVFVHPCEFLVTSPEGEIWKRELLGDANEPAEAQMTVTKDQVGGKKDANKVYYFDLPVKNK